MPMTPYSGDVEIITNIGTTPAERGLETDQFKAKFDEGLKAFVTWFNDTHKTEFDAHLAEDASTTEKGHVQLGTTSGTALEGLHAGELVSDEGGVHGLEVESGTFTPVVEGTTTAGTNTYSIQDGKYYLIGKLCHIDMRIQLSAKDAAMAGYIKIAGLPFTPKSDTNKRPGVLISRASYYNLDATRNILNAVIYTGAVYLYNDGDNDVFDSAPVAQVTNNTELVMSADYEIA